MSDDRDAFRLDGRVALVTGAGRGLGRVIARSLAGAGASLLVTGRDAAATQVTVAEITAQGGRAVAAALEISSEAQWEAAIGLAIRTFGGLDIVVNNAGIETMELMTEMSLESFRRIQDTNATGTFIGMQQAVRAMRPGGISGRGGSIVNVASISGIVGFVGATGYAASKGAIRGMTKAVATECGRFGWNIRVNSIHPGVFHSEMLENVCREYVQLGLLPDMKTAMSSVEAMAPLGIGQADDVANAVRYLASDAARWVTGSELVVDGGAVNCR